MRYWSCAWALALLALTDCRKAATRSFAADAGTRLEARVGSDEQGAAIRFQITRQYQQQKPLEHPPWHEAGGDWTFAEARTEDGIVFGFAVSGPKSSSEISFGQAMLTVADAEQGARLVSRFAQVFNGRLPAAKPKQPLRFQPFGMAVLGSAQVRDPDGSYASGANGSWTVAKLFLQRSGLEAEVYFNFDLVHGQGEFSEKDGEYADDLVAYLARELRDGPQPRRTHQTDAQIAERGLRVEPFRPLGKPKARFQTFSDDGRLLYSVRETPGVRLISASLSKAEDERVLIHVDRELGSVSCGRGGKQCLVEEILNERQHVTSSEDPRQIWLIDAGQSKVLQGPWAAKPSIVSNPFSPGGEYLALAGHEPRSGKRGTFSKLYFLPRAGGAPLSPNLGEKFAEVIGWSGSGAKLRAIIRSGFEFDHSERWLSVDPRSGAVQALPQRPPEGDDTLSPDGRQRVSCDLEKRELIVSELATNKARDRIHEDELPGLEPPCASWVNARYLLYGVDPWGLLDTTTMHLSYPIAEGEQWESVQFDPRALFAIGQRENGLFVGAITGP